jgi:hypothetical protein
MAGCQQAGLSPREVSGVNASRQPGYSNYVYALYNEGDAVLAARPIIRTPLRVGVVQLGEVAPPQRLLEELRRHSDLIAAAQPMPGIFQVDQPAASYSNDPKVFASEVESQARRHISQMRHYARDLGLDYVLLIGGTVDYGSSSNGLSVLDLTLVGAFVVPSKELGATGRASGALIDVASGRMMLAVTSEASSKRLASSFGQDGDREKQLYAMRNDLLTKLGTEFVARVQNP